MTILNPPPADSVDYQHSDGVIGTPREGWRNFFQAVYTICSAITSSGATAQRPTKFLWVGRVFFDTTLGFPIWYNGSLWVDADGISV